MCHKYACSDACEECGQDDKWAEVGSASASAKEAGTRSSKDVVLLPLQALQALQCWAGQAAVLHALHGNSVGSCRVLEPVAIAASEAGGRLTLRELQEHLLNLVKRRQLASPNSSLNQGGQGVATRQAARDGEADCAWRACLVSALTSVDCQVLRLLNLLNRPKKV